MDNGTQSSRKAHVSTGYQSSTVPLDFFRFEKKNKVHYNQQYGTHLMSEFISKLKASGMDKIIAEKQKQLDEWAKTNK